MLWLITIAGYSGTFSFLFVKILFEIIEIEINIDKNLNNLIVDSEDLRLFE